MLSLAQSSNEKVLFIIDSIPLYSDPEYWDPISGDDIADMTVIRNKDALKLLGWEDPDVVKYVFTKAYRNRPDSIKRIPSLKQMKMISDSWYFHDTIYSGKYIDYYNNGQIQDEGNLLYGKLNGVLIVYFKNGNKKTVAHYSDGLLNGKWIEYYKNGLPAYERMYTAGKAQRSHKMYFINGQIQEELRLKKETRNDTLIKYYSTGAVKQMKYTMTGVFTPDKKETDINYYTTFFNKSIDAGDIKAANKNFYHIWLLDSTSNETYFNEGFLFFKEGRYDRAIAAFDLALVKEPLMREALLYRGYSRFKKYADSNNTFLDLETMRSVPNEALGMICEDLSKADGIGPGDDYVKKRVPVAVLNYCRSIINH